MDCKYPEIEVELIGNDGNAFAVLGAVSKALRQNGHASEVDKFQKEATSGDYDHLLQTVMNWVTVTSEDDSDDEEDYDEDSDWYNEEEMYEETNDDDE